jgi:N-methylhydantoinase A
LILGRVDPDFFLGGEMALEVENARAALKERVAAPTGLGVEEAADGIVRIVNTNMAKAIRSILIERGHDPRDFVLMGFGGGGGLHAGAVMRELNIPRAVVPSNPGALSAIGMLGTDFRHDRARTFVRPIAELDPAEAEAVLALLEQEARTALLSEGVPESSLELVRSADLRYVGQEYHLNVPCGPLLSVADADGLAREFNAAHERVYGYATREFAVQLVNLRVVGIGRTERPPVPRIDARTDGGDPETREIRPVYFSEAGFVDTPIYDVDTVRAGDRLPGPSILEDPRSTMVILPGQHGLIDEFRNLHIYEGEE